MYAMDAAAMYAMHAAAMYAMYAMHAAARPGDVHRGRACQHGKKTRWEPREPRGLAELERCEGRELGGLQYHAAAGGQGDRHLLSRHLFDGGEGKDMQ